LYTGYQRYPFRLFFPDGKKIPLDKVTKHFFLAARFIFLQQEHFSYCKKIKSYGKKKKSCGKKTKSWGKKKTLLSLYQEEFS